MWFDARAVAAEIAGGEQPPATHPDTGKRELRPATIATTATNHPHAAQSVATVAIVAGVSVQKPKNTGAVGVPTCVDCGASHWLVGVTEPDGSTLHVDCWKARGPARHPGAGQSRKQTDTTATSATTATSYPHTPDFVAEVASVAGVSLQNPKNGQVGRSPYFCGVCREWETLRDPCAHIREILSWGLPA